MSRQFSQPTLAVPSKSGFAYCCDCNLKERRKVPLLIMFLRIRSLAQTAQKEEGVNETGGEGWGWRDGDSVRGEVEG